MLQEVPVKADVVSVLSEGDSVTVISSVLNTHSAVQTMRPSAPLRVSSQFLLILKLLGIAVYSVFHSYRLKWANIF